MFLKSKNVIFNSGGWLTTRWRRPGIQTDLQQTKMDVESTSITVGEEIPGTSALR